MGEAWLRVAKKHKSDMSNNELHTYFDFQMRGVGKRPNQGCNCISNQHHFLF